MAVINNMKAALTSKRYLVSFSYVGTNYCGIQRDPTLKQRRKAIMDVLEVRLGNLNRLGSPEAI